MESFQKTSSGGAGIGTSQFDWADTACMNRAIDLSWDAAGLTFPNPMVGAVVVNHGEIVGEGFKAGLGVNEMFGKRVRRLCENRAE